MELLSGIAVITLLAALLTWILTKLGQSAILAYIAIGVLVGPSGPLKWIPQNTEVGNLSEIGVIFLLFFIGLEFQLEALKKVARLATIGTALQIASTAVLTGGAALALGFSVREALVGGVACALSSTAIVMKAFEDRREADSATAQSSLAILLGQDLIALLFVAAMPLLLGVKGGGEGGMHPALGFLIMAAALPVLFILSKKFLPIIFNRAAISKNQEVFALCSLGACLLVAWLAHFVGASPALGAFMGGLVFSGTPYAHQIRADLIAIKNLSLGFFFLTVGMLMDLGYVASHVPLLLAGLVLLIALKTGAAAGVFRFFKYPWNIAAGGGLALAQVSEFAFVLVSESKKADVFSPDNGQLLISLAVLSMFLAPALVGRSLRFGDWLAIRLHVPPAPQTTGESEAADSESPHALPAASETRAIVVGYGPVGITLCKILIRFGIRPFVVDLNLETIKKLQAMGRDAVFGDGTNREVLHACGIQDARYLIITVPNFATRASIIASARNLNPGIAIVSRARYLDERVHLENAGASHISYEEAEVAAELARLILTELGARPDLLSHEVAKLRAEIAVRTGFTIVNARPMDAPAGQSLMWSPKQANTPGKSEANS
ncbi:MAG: cation:proton antiporter [Planctomycetes bacterium]|nr:cation:proton antiporter [Planctomycetota bacterium]